MKTKLIYLLTGIVLVSGMYFTKTDDMDKDTLVLIEKALEIDSKLELWPGYKLGKYPIDVNYENVEFRYFKGDIIEKKPTLEVLAFTAWVEEGQPVVKVLPESMLSQVLNVMGNMSSEKMEYHYIKTLFHEGFHAFQIERGIISDIDSFQANNEFEANNIHKTNNSPELNPHSEDNKENSSSYEKFLNILYLLDNDIKYRKLWTEEEKSLMDYFKNNNKEGWVKCHNRRVKYLKEVLGDDFDFYIKMENDRELVEGTARYIEDKIMDILTGKVDEISVSVIYSKGVSKFYTTGRIKCLILDKNSNFQDNDWKENLFNSQSTLTDLLMHPY